jgi:hypothetical protein
MSGFEDIAKAASAQGMYLVDHTNIIPLIAEYEDAVKESARLCLVADPMETPFKSKYAARELLDGVSRKLEATRTILSLEGKKDVVNNDVDWRYNVLRVLLGAIAYEVEEPHNTQIELEAAIDFFLPGFCSRIDEQCPADAGTECAGVEVLAEGLPDLAPTDIRFCGEILKCVNMLGILWAGREQIKKSFLYLHSAKRIYGHISKLALSESAHKEIESLYTHNIFYLAQAYGHIGNAKLSCKYCHETLNRQLSYGVDEAGALEWVKNCMGIADFHMATNQYKKCAYSLAASEAVLNEKVLPLLAGQESFADWRTGVREIEADLHRRWLRLEINNLKRSLVIKAKYDSDLPNSAISTSSINIENQFHGIVVDIPSLFDDISENDDISAEVGTASFVRSIEEATLAFKRGFARADAAKKILLLDGSSVYLNI